VLDGVHFLHGRPFRVSIHAAREVVGQSHCKAL
jgi:hypothetical protein